jgi:hypothetical protein
MVKAEDDALMGQTNSGLFVNPDVRDSRSQRVCREGEADYPGVHVGHISSPPCHRRMGWPDQFKIQIDAFLRENREAIMQRDRIGIKLKFVDQIRGDQ